MQLTISGTEYSGAVTAEAIEGAIRSLADQEQEEGFVILSLSTQTYVQVAGTPQDGYVLEYRDGTPDQHYSCENPNLTEDEVIGVFLHFFAQDDEWKQCVPWTSTWAANWMDRDENEAAQGSSGGMGRAAIVIAVLIALAVVAWLVVKG